MAQFPTVQIKLADAAASVDAARTILLRDLEAIAVEVRQNGHGSVQQRILNRRDQSFAVNLALCVALVPRFGLYGAAIATATAVVVESVLLFVVIVYHVMRTTVRGKKAERCANCGKTDVRPSWSAGIVDRLLAWCHHYPYRCRACYYRYYRCRRTPPTVVE